MNVSPSAQPRLVRVAVAVPLADAFDYLWSAAGDLPPAGSRVRVPFGRRERIGVVLDHPSTTALSAEKLKPIRESLDREPLIGAELMQTLRWAADYYHHPIGEVLNHALPSVLRDGRGLDEPPELVWRLTELGRVQSRERIARSARQQARALGLLAERPLTESDLKLADVGAATLVRLAAKQWIEAAPAPAADPPPIVSQALPELTSDQRAVVGAIARGEDATFRAYLLHGVTGSGKTEVYLRLIAHELAAGRQTLLLVPEIGLTPQLVGRLRARFGDGLAVLHSGLTERERFVAWRSAHAARAKLVVGTRSAVFAPLPAGGLIIVDEEHDPSYKQQRGFRYSARDLAVVRAQRLKIPVVLASATPSLESFHNASAGRYSKLEMPRRIGSAGQPLVRVLDLGRLATRQALSTPLVSAIERHLAAGSQVMLFLNRRGFAPALFCTACKSVEECSRCDARMTVHAKAAVLRCHHCGQERPLRWACAACGNERLAVGAGTQRVGDELSALFPGVRIARLDRDATSRKGALAAVLADVESGATQILIGTQMLTKGHDFPRVTLVGVLNADQGLFGTDPRSHERLAQTIVQVAGRAGRGDLPGEVLIQTHYPQHPLLERLLTADYAAFAILALEERRTTEWPPFSHLAAWRAESIERAPAFAFLNGVKETALENATAPVKVLGPAPQQMERREGRYRAQLLFQSAQRAPLHELLGKTLLAVRSSPDARKVRWSVDVDPIEL